MISPGLAEVKYVPVDAAMRDYLVRSSTPPDSVVTSLAEHTARVGDAAGMMVPVEQATLLTMLTRLVGAVTAVDIGTFTGLSALAIARGLAPGGRVVTCDVTDQWHDLAREHWERAGVADRIEFRLGSAARTLGGLAEDGAVADLVFIDADKMNYPTYYRLVVPMLRPGGLLICDNILQDGTSSTRCSPRRACRAGAPRPCATSTPRSRPTTASRRSCCRSRMA